MPITNGTPGPQPDRLKINVPWDVAAGRLVKVKKPAEGWPDAKPKAKKRRAKKKAKRK